MAEDKTSYKIDRVDFGINIEEGSSPVSTGRSSSPKSEPLSLKKVSGYVKSFFSKTRVYTKKTNSFFNKTKWRFSRSIFLGRGLYFKYISNLALLLAIAFGAFVYLGYNSDEGSFISKYSSVSASGSSVLFSAGSQTALAQKQLRVTQYTVKKGDTLSTIASQYTTADNIITVDTILWANGLRATDVLKTGMVLDIPPVSGVLHTVKKGDTVISIATKYKLITDKSSPEEVSGVTQQIVDINLLDVKVVQTGDGETKVPELVEGSRIIVPGGVIIADVPKPVVIKNSSPSAVISVPIVAQPGQKFMWPVYGNLGIVSNTFKSWHRATDIAYGRSWTGPYLVALADGTVRSAKWEAGGGANVVRIDFDNGFSALYAHMSVFDAGIVNALNAGQRPRVSQGQVIGRMGCTGACTGPHVHLELTYRGSFLNPCSYLPRC